LADRTPCVRLRREFGLLLVVYGDAQPSIVLPIPRLPEELAAPRQIRVALVAPRVEPPGRRDQRRGQKIEESRRYIAGERVSTVQVAENHPGILTSYKVMLKAYTSEGGRFREPFKSSGAIQLRLPCIWRASTAPVRTVVSALRRARPKSHNSARPELSTRTFIYCVV
jgi:hypothetical protein